MDSTELDIDSGGPAVYRGLYQAGYLQRHILWFCRSGRAVSRNGLITAGLVAFELR